VAVLGLLVVLVVVLVVQVAQEVQEQLVQLARHLLLTTGQLLNMDKAQQDAIIENLQVQDSPADELKITINVYDKIVDAEQATGKKIDFKQLLVDFLDSYLQNYECTQEEKDKVALIRSRVMILL
jgi:DNA repair protein RadC